MPLADQEKRGAAERQWFFYMRSGSHSFPIDAPGVTGESVVSIGALIVRTEPGPYQWILETASEIRDDAWQATIERVELGPEMRLYLTSAKVRRALTLQPHQADPEPWLLHQMVLQGSVNLSATDGQSIELTPARAALFRTHDRHARFTPAWGQNIRLAGYMLRLDRIRRLSGGALPGALRPLARSDLGVSHLVKVRVDSAQRRLARSLFDHRLRGALRALFLEGVVLQLFALQSAATEDGADRRARVGLGRGERAAILAARERLLADMRAPPMLGELAAFAGMNEKALNAGFKTLFGTTVFATLRNARLEHARAALASGCVTMKQAAFAVGYNHVTNFSAAFAERYGEPPRRYARREIAARPK
jgi:AraC-like DNA-binding protein